MTHPLMKMNRKCCLPWGFCLLLSLPFFASGQETIGEKLFLENCAECHQTNGQGIANVYPALAGNSLVKGSAVDVALVLLIGRGEMPAFAGMIPNEEIAAIINYVRNTWGNEGELISAESIARLQ
jgi:cytochrome c oxidase subunit 2